MNERRLSRRGSLRDAGAAMRQAQAAASKNEPTESQKQQLREAFDLFDTEQTNTLDYHSLKCAMRALGFEVKKKDVLKLMEQHD
eukprot:1863613-Prymnesium_polylepis.1